MKSNIFFLVGLVFLGHRLLRWFFMGFGIFEDIPGPNSLSSFQLSTIFILSSIYLRIDEHLKLKTG